MKRNIKLLLCMVVGGWLGLHSQASAMIGTIDVVPAATLLLPYFEVDIANANGVNTLFSINNASSFAVLAHVTVWSDQSVPVLNFDVYLTGFDVQDISLRDVFVNGNVPRTASVGQDPKDTISPKGPGSQDIDFASCSSFPYPTPYLSAPFRAHLQAWLQGNQSPSTGNCAGSKKKDNILRGYVTIDAVNGCNLFNPSDWANYKPYLTNQNVLWGDVRYVYPGLNLADLDTLVHIEACPDCFQPGNHTFYGRYNSASAADAREALPTTMAARYTRSISTDAQLLVWREANAAASPYSCSSPGPSWYPLLCSQIILFDTQENATADDCSEARFIVNEASRVIVASDLLAPANSGFVYLNLQHNNTAYPNPYAQMWLTTVIRADGKLSGAYAGVQLDNANDPIIFGLPIGGGQAGAASETEQDPQ
jgi:hypothetical protein